MKRFAVVAVCVLGTCVPLAARAQNSPIDRASFAQDRMRTLRETTSQTHGAVITTVPYADSLVFTALQLVYDNLGIPITDLNADSGTVGNKGFVLMRSLANRPASHYFDCGAGSSIPVTETQDYQITITVFSAIVGNGPNTTLGTWTTAVGRSNGTVNADVACHSNGRLEKLIAKNVADMLKK